MFGMAVCECGRLCTDIGRHKSRGGCPLAPATSTPPPQPIPRDDDDEDSTKIFNLYSVLSDDAATPQDVEQAFDCLAHIPHFPRMWRPLEIKQLNRTFSRLCSAYMKLERPVDLLRIFAVTKIGASPLITKNKLGDLTRRLTDYPYLGDQKLFLARWKSYQGRSRHAPATLSGRVHACLKQGRVGAAARHLSPSRGIAMLTDVTVEKLRELHPSEDEHSWPNEPSPGPIIKLEHVGRTLATVDPETAGGPSGLDGRTMAALKHNPQVREFLLVVTRAIAAGRQQLAPLFTASRLIPLRKDDKGGIRPLAVGEIIYRLATKTICRATTPDLLPYQLGVGTTGGVEPAIEYIRHAAQSQAVLTIDLQNAFNSMSRQFLFEGVEKWAPDLQRTFSWAYSKHSKLFLADGRSLTSQKGVRQGDPLGPMLFSIGFRSILEPLHQRLRDAHIETALPLVAYLDDTLVCCEPHKLETARQVVHQWFTGCQNVSGLRFRPDKTRCSNPADFQTVGVDVLGSHVGGGTTEFIKAKIEAWESSVSRLSSLSAQDGYLLLRQCLLPQLAHLMRTTSPGPAAWERADEALTFFSRRFLGRFDVPPWDSQLQDLPLRFGGLGLARPSTIAPHARSASTDLSISVLQQIVKDALWLHQPIDPRRQRARLTEHWTAVRTGLSRDLSMDQLAQFQDNSSVLGSKWLQALPLSQSLTLSDLSFSGALANRLLVAPASCSRCKRQSLGPNHHELCCGQSLCTRRHDAVKSALAKGFLSSGHLVQVEPPQIGSSGARRADLLVEGDSTEGKAALDVSITCVFSSQATPVADSVTHLEGMPTSISLPTAPADRRALAFRLIRQKLQRRHDRKLAAASPVFFGARFSPFVLSTGGTLHAASLRLITALKSTSPRVHNELIFELSCALAKHRAQAYASSFIFSRYPSA